MFPGSKVFTRLPILLTVFRGSLCKGNSELDACDTRVNLRMNLWKEVVIVRIPNG